jgi:hypothetical protein
MMSIQALQQTAAALSASREFTLLGTAAAAELRRSAWHHEGAWRWMPKASTTPHRWEDNLCHIQ